MKVDPKHIERICEDIYRTTDYPDVRTIMQPFTRQCPSCGLDRRFWRIDINTHKPPIQENRGNDIVRYTCICGERFKKIELKEGETA